jgi:hypothetical protein
LNGSGDKLGLKNIIFSPDLKSNTIRANNIKIFEVVNEQSIIDICNGMIKKEEAYYVKETLYYMLARRLNESVTR